MKADIINRSILQKLNNVYELLNEVYEYDFITKEDYLEFLQTLYNMNIRSYNKGFFTRKISQEEQEKKYKLDNISKARFRDENYCCILKNFEHIEENITVRARDHQERYSKELLENIIYNLKDYIIYNLDDYVSIQID